MSSPNSPSQNPVSLTPQGPPTTVIPLEDPAIRHELSQALAVAPDSRREAVAVVVSHHPRSLISWANIGDLGRDNLERYAYYRIGYHRGLDTLRQNGWRGSGYVLAMSDGTKNQITAFCAVCLVCKSWPKRLAKPMKPSVVIFSCYSSTHRAFPLNFLPSISKTIAVDLTDD